MSSENAVLEKFLDSVKWDANGLVCTVVQDEKDGAILMVAYMNRESFKRTILEGKACFWSRSRQKFWLKGEESGNVQEVKKIFVDCDVDCVLLQVKQIGDAACHTGMRSCFYRQVSADGNLKEVGTKIFDPAKVYKK
jgi:phosphoribosyl-AMP cyclohydrolase